MRESKAELTDRLRREGRWEAFKKRREELKAEGVPAKEAWWQAASEFSPQAGQHEAHALGRLLTQTEFRAIKRKPCIKIGQAVRWAFDHLEGE